MTLLATASGLMIESVRSTAMLATPAQKLQINSKLYHGGPLLSRCQARRRRRAGTTGGETRRRVREARSGGYWIIPSARGKTSVSHGQYVTMTRNTSIVSSHGHTA